MNCNNLRLEIQRYEFAAHDMHLYLDTHPEDEKAFAIYKSLAAKTLELKAEYVKLFGPLQHDDAVYRDEFEWLNCPWPWEKGGNI